LKHSVKSEEGRNRSDVSEGRKKGREGVLHIRERGLVRCSISEVREGWEGVL